MFVFVCGFVIAESTRIVDQYNNAVYSSVHIYTFATNLQTANHMTTSYLSL